MSKLPFKMLCPMCDSEITKPIEAYHAKLIPYENMPEKPECEMDYCYNIAKWNINNGYPLCDKHFRDLCNQGIPVIIISKSMLKMDDDGKLKKEIK